MACPCSPLNANAAEFYPGEPQRIRMWMSWPAVFEYYGMRRYVAMEAIRGAEVMYDREQGRYLYLVIVAIY